MYTPCTVSMRLACEQRRRAAGPMVFEAQRSVLVKFVRKCRRYFATGTAVEVWAEFAEPLRFPLQPAAFEVTTEESTCRQINSHVTVCSDQWDCRASSALHLLASFELRDPGDQAARTPYQDKLCSQLAACHRRSCPVQRHPKRPNVCGIVMAGARLPEPADAHARDCGAGG